MLCKLKKISKSKKFSFIKKLFLKSSKTSKKQFFFWGGGSPLTQIVGFGACLTLGGSDPNYRKNLVITIFFAEFYVLHGQTTHQFRSYSLHSNEMGKPP